MPRFRAASTRLFWSAIALVSAVVLTAWVATVKAEPSPPPDVASGSLHRSSDAGPSALNPETPILAPRVELASLQPVPDLLKSLTLTSTPTPAEVTVADRFAQAEAKRVGGNPVDAVLDYIRLIDQFPDTPQADAADGRAGYVMNQLDAAQWEALEAAVPDAKDLKTLDSILVLGQFHVLCARQLAQSDPAKAAQHIQTVYAMAWRAFEDDLDDDYKMTIVEEYLLAAEMLGKGAETRAALSAHADTLPWCFTRWLIEAEIDGTEPDPAMVTSQEGLESIRKYYLLKGRDTTEGPAATAYFIKSRDLGKRMLETQPANEPRFNLAHAYLEAAHEAGPESAAEAVAYVEKHLETQPLSIMRWIVRYELAVYLTRVGAPAEQTVAGFQHFDAMLVEAEEGFVEAAIQDTNIDVELRGLLACVWGHAFAGTNRVDEAVLFYDWVLEYCPVETHPGESAAYSKAVMYERQHGYEKSACATVYEDFVAKHPSSYYAPHAKIRVAEIHAEQGDAAAALAIYEEVARDYQNRSAADDVASRVAELEADVRSGETGDGNPEGAREHRRHGPPRTIRTDDASRIEHQRHGGN